MLRAYYKENTIEAGCDEAGRGCLAGPVFAASVILSPEFEHPLLNDSKQMTERNRELLRDIICREAVAWAVEMITAEEIDRVNILNASFAAMSAAVSKLKIRPDLLLIDGNRFKTSLDIPYQCVVKGDATFMSIAAASVLAKTFRDDWMRAIDREYPQYGWAKNKGYPTREHRLAIAQYGMSPYHRRTFNHTVDQLSLF